MLWPSPQDYNEVIQTPQVCFADSELRSGVPDCTALGLPKVITGAFASVYRLHCPQRDVAVRCFLTRVPGIERRYRELHAFMLQNPLSHTVNFEYIPNGIRVGVKLFPVLKMDWIDGQSLTEYVGSILQEKQKVIDLQSSFAAMLMQLRNNGIAHGDLQHGNVIVVDGALRLVDYDGMYVPSMSGMISNENGHGNFQHPRRNEKYFGPQIDTFSAWIIYLSLGIIAEEPELWRKFNGGDECLLFRQTDYRAPAASALIQTLSLHDNEYLRNISKLVRLLSTAPIDQLPLFDAAADLCEVISALEDVCEKLAALVPEVIAPPAQADIWNPDNMHALGCEPDLIVEDGQSAYERGLLLQNAGYHESAVSAFTRCKSRADDDELHLQAQESSVISLFFLEKYEEAVREYLSAQQLRRVAIRSKYGEKTGLGDAARQAYLVCCGLNFYQDKYFNHAAERFLEALEYVGQISHAFIRCQLGVVYQMEGKFALARAQLELASSKIEDEEDKGLAFRLGNLLLDVDSRAFAARCFHRCLELASFPRDPLYVESLLGCAKVCIKEGSTIEALTRLRAARELLDLCSRSARTSLLCRIGMLFLELNLLIDAGNFFKEALHVDIRSAPAHLGLSHVLARTHDHEGAREHLHKALRHDPSLTEAHIAKAEMLNIEGYPAEAMVHFNEAIRLRPTTAEPYLRAGNFFFKKNHLQEAVQIFSEAIARGMFSPSLLFRRGLAYARLNEHDAALRDFDRCLEIDPTHFAAHFNKGMLYKLMRRKTEALAAFNQALALRPRYARILEQRAHVLKELKRFSEAILDCDVILKEEPNHGMARTIRGMCHFEQGNFQSAAKDLATALVTREDDLDGWTSYICSLGELGDHEKVIYLATACLADLVKSRYKSQHLLANGRLAKLELLFERGKAYARQGRNVEALADFVASDFFHDLRVIRERALVHKQLGNLELAAEDFASIAMLVRPLDAYAAFQAAALYFQSRQNKKYLLDSKFQNLKFIDLFDQSLRVRPECGLLKEAANCWYAKAEQLFCDPTQEQQVLELLGRALKSDPEHFPALIARGRLLSRTMPQSAITDFIQACKTHPERVEVHVERGKCAYILRNYHDAIESFSLSIELKAILPGYYWRAKSFAACGAFAAGMTDLRALLKQLDWQTIAICDPSLAEIAELAVDICTQAGGDAVQQLISFLDEFGSTADNVPLVLQRSLLKLARNLHADALKDFDHVLKIAEKRRAIYPTESLEEVLRAALWGRGRTFIALEKLGKARRDFAQLGVLNSHCHHYFGMALICMEEYRFVEAAQHLDQAIVFDADRAELYEQKAIALEKSGDREQAATMRQLALQKRLKRDIGNLLSC